MSVFGSVSDVFSYLFGRVRSFFTPIGMAAVVKQIDSLEELVSRAYPVVAWISDSLAPAMAKSHLPIPDVVARELDAYCPGIVEAKAEVNRSRTIGDVYRTVAVLIITKRYGVAAGNLLNAAIELALLLYKAEKGAKQS